nr:uncharacterized protein LOC117685476 [Crassostrea gigas]
MAAKADEQFLISLKIDGKDYQIFGECHLEEMLNSDKSCSTKPSGCDADAKPEPANQKVWNKKDTKTLYDNLGVYFLYEHTIRTIKSRYEKSGRSLKYYVPAIVQGETTTKNISTFKKTLIESLKPGRHYRLVNATCHPTFGIELKADSIIMDTLFELTEDEKKMRTNFFSPPTFTMAEASSLAARDSALARSK